MDCSVTGPDEESKPTPRLGVTLRAERVISRLCRDLGRQVLLLSWPAGAAYLPVEMFQQSDFDVIVGHIERWPIYADARQLRLFCDEQLVIDVKVRVGGTHAAAAGAPTGGRVGGSRGATGAARSHPVNATMPRTAARVTLELNAQFAGSLPATAISVCVLRAIRDLQGSTNPEGLPEMAVRLARVRLAKLTPVADTAPPPGRS